jgi:hypothetical protein
MQTVPGINLRVTREQAETVAALLAQEADELEEHEDPRREGFKRRIYHLRRIVDVVEKALKTQLEG